MSPESWDSKCHCPFSPIKVIKPGPRSPFTNHFVTRRCCGTNRAQRKAEDRGTSDEAAALLRGPHAERQESVYLQQHTNQKPAGCQHFRQGCRTLFCSKLSVKRLAKSHPQAQGGHQQADEPCRRFPRGTVIRPWDGCDRTVQYRAIHYVLGITRLINRRY